MIDPTASDCKKVTRYVNTASDIKPPSDKLPANAAPIKTESTPKPVVAPASNKVPIKVKLFFPNAYIERRAAEKARCASQTVQAKRKSCWEKEACQYLKCNIN